MKTKNDESTEQTENLSEQSSGLLQTLDYLVKTGITTAAVIAIQSPIKTMQVNLTNGGGMPNYSSIGSFGFFRALYAGTAASLASSSARTAYVTAAKTGKPAEGKETPYETFGKVNLKKAGYVVCAAFGDIVATQVSETLSTLRKVHGLLPEGFLWYKNIPQLMTNGFIPRYASGLVNFGALCILEDEIAKKIPFKDSKWQHLSSGLISGIIAGTVSYPFAVCKDYIVIQAKVNEQNLLVNKGTFVVLSELGKAFFQHPAEMGKSFLANAAKQAPLRAGATGTVFAIVASFDHMLGNNTLKSIKQALTFFSTRPDTEGLTSPSKADNPLEDTTSSTPLHP
ncbi:periplasmic ligand-binding sensor domain protein [Legionella nautarum]|uniref:Periplasmic ligand-binding sensor domain protein n=1 Tax=Legionella nautarum TaxID=45070 RepID=A0A0W0WUQ0_9GAMM|nr:hypothetical protein [Legionella nautarum]KTD36041.1 periplasmic ligand-binding sensor domain protein [Legionella nautarum]